MQETSGLSTKYSLLINLFLLFSPVGQSQQRPLQFNPTGSNPSDPSELADTLPLSEIPLKTVAEYTIPDTTISEQNEHKQSDASTRKPKRKIKRKQIEDIIEQALEKDDFSLFKPVLNQKTSDLPSILTRAIQGNKINIVRGLLANKVLSKEISIASDQIRYILSAIKANNIEIVNALIDYGCRLDFRDQFGGTPLFYAAQSDLAILKRVMAAMGNPRDTPSPQYVVFKEGISGLTPLMNAIKGGYLENIRFLVIDIQVDLKTKNYKGENALDFSVSVRGPDDPITVLIRERVELITRVLDVVEKEKRKTLPKKETVGNEDINRLLAERKKSGGDVLWGPPPLTYLAMAGLIGFLVWAGHRYLHIGKKKKKIIPLSIRHSQDDNEIKRKPTLNIKDIERSIRDLRKKYFKLHEDLNQSIGVKDVFINNYYKEIKESTKPIGSKLALFAKNVQSNINEIDRILQNHLAATNTEKLKELEIAITPLQEEYKGIFKKLNEIANINTLIETNKSKIEKSIITCHTFLNQLQDPPELLEHKKFPLHYNVIGRLNATLSQYPNAEIKKLLESLQEAQKQLEDIEAELLKHQAQITKVDYNTSSMYSISESINKLKPIKEGLDLQISKAEHYIKTKTPEDEKEKYRSYHDEHRALRREKRSLSRQSSSSRFSSRSSSRDIHSGEYASRSRSSSGDSSELTRRPRMGVRSEFSTTNISSTTLAATTTSVAFWPRQKNDFFPKSNPNLMEGMEKKDKKRIDYEQIVNMAKSYKNSSKRIHKLRPEFLCYYAYIAIIFALSEAVRHHFNKGRGREYLNNLRNNLIYNLGILNHMDKITDAQTACNEFLDMIISSAPQYRGDRPYEINFYPTLQHAQIKKLMNPDPTSAFEFRGLPFQQQIDDYKPEKSGKTSEFTELAKRYLNAQKQLRLPDSLSLEDQAEARRFRHEFEVLDELKGTPKSGHESPSFSPH